MNTAVTDEKKHYTPTLQLHPKLASSKLHAVEEDLVPVARTIWKITLTSELRLMLAWQARPNLHTGLSSNRNLHSIRRLSSTPLMHAALWEATMRVHLPAGTSVYTNLQKLTTSTRSRPKFYLLQLQLRKHRPRTHFTRWCTQKTRQLSKFAQLLRAELPTCSCRYAMLLMVIRAPTDDRVKGLDHRSGMSVK